eukprot:m.34855 g.34855  ORF g.34855 m.34855 type:complete len:182 (-) comp12718_c0_seq1:1080-1625(-)
MMDEQGFNALLVELDDETLREMLIHVSASSPDAVALILANISKRQNCAATDIARLGGAGSAGPAVAGPGSLSATRLWRSFSHEDIVSESFMAIVEAGDAAVPTSAKSRASVRPLQCKSVESTPTARRRSLERSASADNLTEEQPRRGSTTKWWKFGVGKKGKDDTPRSVAKSKRASSKTTA